MRRRLPLLLGAVTIALVAAIFLLRPSSAVKTPASGAVAVGKPAPDFSLQDVNGKSVHLGSQRGNVILLDFWATWCVPCRSEMPAIEHVYRSHPGHFVVLAIDKNEPASDVRAFARRYGLTFPLVLDPALAVWNSYGIRIQPVSVWIDRNGTIRAIHYGPMDPGSIGRELARLSA